MKPKDMTDEQLRIKVHAIVEIVSTGERGRIFGNPIGKTGEVFKVPRYVVREAGK